MPAPYQVTANRPIQIDDAPLFYFPAANFVVGPLHRSGEASLSIDGPMGCQRDRLDFDPHVITLQFHPTGVTVSSA